ncbi:hypothetical protein Q3G72_026710 [Acer saccharum]|nr:hypothetical protein Q3G72_026710 [Acer saccharum]
MEDNKAPKPTKKKQNQRLPPKRGQVMINILKGGFRRIRCREKERSYQADSLPPIRILFTLLDLHSRGGGDHHRIRRKPGRQRRSAAAVNLAQLWSNVLHVVANSNQRDGDVRSPSSLDRVSIVFFKTSTPSMEERFKDKSLFFIQLSSVGVDVR